MGMLSDVCHELTGRLSVASVEARVMLENLDKFNEHVGSFAAGRLNYRLRMIQIYIMAQVGYLHVVHQGQGHICVLLSEVEGLTILWVRSRSLVPDKVSSAAYGYRVLSAEETDNTISQVISDVSGNWARAVDWLSHYGKPAVFQYNL